MFYPKLHIRHTLGLRGMRAVFSIAICPMPAIMEGAKLGAVRLVSFIRVR